MTASDRQVFHALLIKGLTVLANNAATLRRDLLADDGLALPASAASLVQSLQPCVEILHMLRRVKELFMAADMPPADQLFCNQFLDLLVRLQAKVVSPLLDLARGEWNVEAEQPSPLRRMLHRLVPPRSSVASGEIVSWGPLRGRERLGDSAKDTVSALGEITQAATQLKQQICQAQ